MFVELQRRLRLEREQSTRQCLVPARHPADDNMGGNAGDQGLKTRISSCRDRRHFDVGKFIGVAGIRTATENRALIATGLTGNDQRAD